MEAQRKEGVCDITPFGVAKYIPRRRTFVPILYKPPISATPELGDQFCKLNEQTYGKFHVVERRNVGVVGSSVRKFIRRCLSLSALSSDHGFVGLSSSGVTHATSTICAYAVHTIILNPSMPTGESREVHVLKDKWECQVRDGGTGIGKSVIGRF